MIMFGWWGSDDYERIGEQIKMQLALLTTDLNNCPHCNSKEFGFKTVSVNVNGEWRTRKWKVCRGCYRKVEIEIIGEDEKS